MSHLAGFYPDLARRTVKAVSRRGLGGVLARTMRRLGGPSSDATGDTPPGNNPKMPERPAPLFWPMPHGAYASNAEELRAFRKGRWTRQFQAAGFDVVRVLPGPVMSGYGFGLDGVRHALERAGLASEYVFVTVKRGSASPFLAYF
jgi:hypothetical protein